MDFGKLSQTEKLATYGAIATIIGGLVAVSTHFTYGIAWLGILAGIGMLVIIFLPQFSPNTALPGSQGSLMLIAGGIAAVALALTLLTSLGFVFRAFGLADIFFLIAVAGALVMGWAAWQAFQAEGGKFSVGTSSTSTAGGADTTSAPRDDAGTTPRDDSATAAPRDESAAAAPPPRDSTTDAPPTGTADQERREPPA